MNFIKSLSIGLIAMTAILSISSCTEEPPVGLFVETLEPLLDTCYLETAAIPEPKNTLVYDITGVRCSNCPKAAEQAKTILDANNGRVSVIALYADIPGLGALTEAWDGFPVLNSVDAQQIIASLGNPGSLPTGCVDQIEVNNNRMVPFTKWSAEVSKRLALPTPVNLEITATYDPSTKAIRVNTKSLFTEVVTDSMDIFVGLTENDIESKQSENRVSSGHVDDYKHEHVLRKLLTGSSGSEIKNTKKCDLLAGTVVEKQFSIIKDDAWKVPAMHAVVWIVSRTTKEVVHVKEVSVK